MYAAQIKQFYSEATVRLRKSVCLRKKRKKEATVRLRKSVRSPTKLESVLKSRESFYTVYSLKKLYRTLTFENYFHFIKLERHPNIVTRLYDYGSQSAWRKSERSSNCTTTEVSSSNLATNTKVKITSYPSFRESFSFYKVGTAPEHPNTVKRLRKFHLDFSRKNCTFCNNSCVFQHP